MADSKVITSIAQTINIEPVKIKRPRIKSNRPASDVKQSEGEVKNQQKKQFNKPAQDRQPKMSKEERYEKFVETLTKVISTDGGKFVRFDDKTYLLLGGVDHEKHLYFMVMNSNRGLEFIPMKSTYRIARNVDATMGVVNYLLERQRNDIIDIVMEFLNTNEDYKLIGELGIKAFRPQRNKNFNGPKKVNKKKQ